MPESAGLDVVVFPPHAGSEEAGDDDSQNLKPIS